MKEGITLFEKNNVKMGYKFRMEYGFASAIIFPNWKERENEFNNNFPQRRSEMFYDDEILTKDRLQIINYIRQIINKTTLENELKEKDMFFGLRIIISGTPSIPTQLSQSNLDYDEYVELK